jgi:hypothetical protein
MCTRSVKITITDRRRHHFQNGCLRAKGDAGVMTGRGRCILRNARTCRNQEQPEQTMTLECQRQQDNHRMCLAFVRRSMQEPHIQKLCWRVKLMTFRLIRSFPFFRGRQVFFSVGFAMAWELYIASSKEQLSRNQRGSAAAADETWGGRGPALPPPCCAVRCPVCQPLAHLTHTHSRNRPKMPQTTLTS